MSYHCQTIQYACSFGLSSSELTERSNALRLQHYQPAYVVTYASSAGPAFAAIWRNDLPASLSKTLVSIPAADFQGQFDALNEQGYAMRCISGAVFGSTLSYASLWDDGGWKDLSTRSNLSANDYQAEFDQHQKDGYNVVWVEGYSNGSASRYSAIWSRFAAATPTRARHNLLIEDYQGVFDEFKALGYYVTHFSAHGVGSKTYVAAVWTKQDGYISHARHNMTECQLQNELERQAWNDWLPVCITGYIYKGATRYAGIWVQNKRTVLSQGRVGKGLEGIDDGLRQAMLTYGIQAASLAVTYQGRLVLARGLSRVTEQGDPVSPTAVFRIASVSKAFTGTAIVKLIEQGKLRFTDRLLDVLGWKDAVHDNRLKDVTVDQLLHHFGGFSRQYSPVGDPMTDDVQLASEMKIALPVTQESIFRWMTTKYDLDFTPGTVKEYSNYGYMLLGMIIERVTGMRYEDYVRAELLLPLRIRRMRIGWSGLGDRLPGEVTYQQRHANLYQNVMTPDAPKDAMQTYGNYNFANMAAHGGWVASAVDLVKFASCFDDPGACPILSSSSVATLLGRSYPTSPTPTAEYFACGWDVLPGSPTETLRTGSFNGTEALMYRRSDGITAAVIINRFVRTSLAPPCPDDPPLPGEGNLPTPDWVGLEALTRTWLGTVASWPSIDMWDEYF